MYTVLALIHGRSESIKCDSEDAARAVMAALLKAGWHAEAWQGMRVL